MRLFFTKQVIQARINDILADSRRLIQVFGLVLFVNYPVFYFIWMDSFSSDYENLPLRLAASALCIPLIFNKYWPKKYLNHLVIYWYLTACFCLPFFYTYMLLRNDINTLWLMNAVAAVFYTMIVFDVIISILIFSVGVTTAMLAYCLTTAPGCLSFLSDINMSGVVITLSCAYIIGNILSRSKQNISAEKQRSLKIAEMHSQAKSDFIANASHDIRTPITGILGMTQDMLDKANEIKTSMMTDKTIYTETLLKDIISNVSENSHYLHTATEELLQSCNEILDISQLDYGKSAEQAKAFNLNNMIQHHIKLLKPISQHKKIELIDEIAESVPTNLIGIPIYLDRIILNLLSNALKFTDIGYVKISISLENCDTHELNKGDEIRLKIIVEDTGIGIPKDKFETIFKHFSRLSPRSSGMYKNSGLGLYAVKRYVNAINGEINLESTVGKGSRFILTIPYIVSDQPDETCDTEPALSSPEIDLNPPAQESIEDSIQSNVIGVSILIVEDSLPVRMAMKAQLKPYCCTLDFAETGFDAIDKVSLHTYDLILMDIGLPDISGIETTKKIRKLPNGHTVPIIALTGHASDPKKRQEALDAGMQDVHCKPLRKAALIAILQQYSTKTLKKNSSSMQTATNSTKEHTIIDIEKSVQMCGGDMDFTREILQMLVDDLKHTKSTITKAYVNNDTRALRAELHRTRGGVCYIKAPQLEETLKNFYLITQAESPVLSDIDKAYDTLLEAIDNFWSECELSLS